MPIAHYAQHDEERMTKQMPPSSPTKANKADRRRSVVVVMLIAVVALGMTMMQHGNEGRENGLPNSVPPTPMIAASGNDASGADETTTVVPLPIAWSGTSAPKVALPVATVTPIGIPTQVASSVPVMTPTIIPTCRVVREYALAGLPTLASGLGGWLHIEFFPQAGDPEWEALLGEGRYLLPAPFPGGHVWEYDRVCSEATMRANINAHIMQRRASGANNAGFASPALVQASFVGPAVAMQHSCPNTTNTQEAIGVHASQLAEPCG